MRDGGRIVSVAAIIAVAVSTEGRREIVVLGRRGPVQAAFTNPEIKELGEMEDADVIIDPADVELDPASAATTILERPMVDPSGR